MNYRVFLQKTGLVVLGVMCAFFVLEGILRAGGAVFFFMQDQRNKVQLENKTTFRILCLGESTTAFGGEHSYPDQLEEVLREKDLDIEISVINKGVPGTNTDKILKTLKSQLNYYEPDMVITMMGINDSFSPETWRALSVSGDPWWMRFKAVRLIGMMRHALRARFEAASLKDTPDQVVSSESLAEKKEPEEQVSESKVNWEGLTFSEKMVHLGWKYISDEAFDRAEDAFLVAVKADPENVRARRTLAEFYFVHGQYEKALDFFRQVIEKDPDDFEAFLFIARCYKKLQQYLPVEIVLQQAVARFPDNDRCYSALAGWCSQLQRYDEAEKLYKKAIQVNPGSRLCYTELEMCYLQQKKYDKVVALFKDGLTQDTGLEKERLFHGLAYAYAKIGNSKKSQEYYTKARRLRAHHYNPQTRENYRRLVKIVQEQDIHLICVQYPLRNVEPLKQMLEGLSGITFVDNEKVFREALKQGLYTDFFIDSFAGDWGHCTPRGNRLLAENVAHVLIEKYFK